MENMIRFLKNYKSDSAKNFHGVFLIDITLQQAYLNQIMRGMPEVFRNQPLVFESTGSMLGRDVRITVNRSRFDERNSDSPIQLEELAEEEFSQDYMTTQMKRAPKPTKKP